MKHVHHTLLKTTAIFLFLILSVPYASAQTGQDLMDKGMKEFGNGEYRTALLSFRDIVLNSSMQKHHGTAYYWIARSYMALNDLEKAQENVEYFISQYESHDLYPDALYQKGRLLYLQEEYQKSIRRLYGFIENYPSNPYKANAYFWVGESLYELGHFDKAESLFRMVVRDFPNSYKYEAAKYRLNLIDLKRREEELLKLLKMSHEEYLKAIENFDRTEKSYEQALTSYRRKLAAATSDNDNELINELNKDVERKDEKIQRLEKKVQKLEKQVSSSETQRGGGEEMVSAEPVDTADETDTQRLLKLKNEALSLKEKLIKKLAESEGGGQ